MRNKTELRTRYNDDERIISRATNITAVASDVAWVQGEERIVGVHAPRRAQGVCGETRRRSLFRTTKIRFYPTIFSVFFFFFSWVVYIARCGQGCAPRLGSTAAA